MKRSHKTMALLFAKRLGLFTLARSLTSNGVRILCYHGIWLANDGFEGDSMFMLIDTFERRLATIAELGYRVVPLETAIRAFEGRATLPPAAVVITIDDGWYSTYAAMLPALRRNAMPATLYCDTEHLTNGKPIAHMMARYLVSRAGSSANTPSITADLAAATDRAAPMEARLEAARKVAERLNIDPEPYLGNKVFDYMTELQLKQAAADGLDVQLHTHRHTLHDHSAPSVRREIEDNRSELAKLLGKPQDNFTHFCYPSGVTSYSAATALRNLGLRSATTVRQGLAWHSSPRHFLPRILDGEHVVPITFEAELSGFAELLRLPGRMLSKLFGRNADA